MRSSKITPEKLKALEEAISKGSYVNAACDYAGVPDSTFYDWMKRGEEEARRIEGLNDRIIDLQEQVDDIKKKRVTKRFTKKDKSALLEPIEKNIKSLSKMAKTGKREVVFVDFSDTIKKAAAGAELHALGKVKSAFGDDWKAAMTYLERRYPDRWGRRLVELQGKDGGPVEVKTTFAAALKTVHEGGSDE